MKIYEKPSVEIKKFDVADIITASVFTINGANDGATATLEQVTGVAGATGIVFEW